MRTSDARGKIGQAAGIAALLFSVGAHGQNLEALVGRGGQVKLSGSYNLTRPLTVAAGTTLNCAKGTVISDSPAINAPFLVTLRGDHISVLGCEFLANGPKVILNVGGNSSDITIRGNHIHSSNHSHGLLLDSPGIHRVKFEDNVMDDVAYGILLNAHAQDTTDVTIERNRFSAVWADAIELNNPVTNDCCGPRAGDIRASQITIRDNFFRVPRHEGSTSTAGFCVGVAGAHDIDISGNDCIAWSAGIHIEDRAYNIKITNNTVRTDDHKTDGEQSAIWVVDGKHLTITGNVIDGSAGDGIHLDFTPQFQASEVEIAQNKITGCGRRGLHIAGGSLGDMNSKIHDNVVSGCLQPSALIGKLKSLSIYSNKMDSKDGCIFDTSKNSNKGEVDIRGNVDAGSGSDANGTCGN